MAIKRAGKQQAAASKKKKTKNDFEADDDAFFLADDDDAKKKEEEDADEDEEAQETAEEKRLRLARAYLDQINAEVEEADDRRGVTGGSDEDEEGSDDDEEGGARRRELMGERLKQDAAEAAGRVHRSIAHRVVIPGSTSSSGGDVAAAGKCHRAHRLAPTALALTSDDTTAFTVSKDGSIIKWDIETCRKTSLYRPGDRPSTSGRNGDGASGGGADWVKRAARVGSKAALYAAAVSSDGKYLAVGGGDKIIYVFDAKSGTFVQKFPGHQDIVTGLVFREGTHQLFSCSFDRTVKLWSIDDGAYMDTLYGHQAQVLCIDMLRAERCATGGSDRSARVWKIPEESQLIFRSPCMSVDCLRYISGTEWVSGTADGCLQLWSQMKKKPVSVIHSAHGPGAVKLHGGASAGAVGPAGGDASAEDVTGWVQSVAVCRNSDLVASGAGDGCVRLWSVQKNKSGSAMTLGCVGGLPTRGFINGLAVARSARFVVAAVGQEPRMGRWLREGGARNGLVLHQLGLEGV